MKARVLRPPFCSDNSSPSVTHAQGEVNPVIYTHIHVTHPYTHTRVLILYAHATPTHVNDFACVNELHRVPTCIRVLHEGSQRLGVNVLDLDLLHAGLAHVVHEHGGEVVGGGGQHQAVGGQAAGASHQHHVAQLALRGARLHLAHQALRVVVGTELVAGSLVRHARRCQGVGATGGGVRVLQRAAGALEAGIGVVHQVPVIKQEKKTETSGAGVRVLYLRGR